MNKDYAEPYRILAELVRNQIQEIIDRRERNPILEATELTSRLELLKFFEQQIANNTANVKF
jgi:hypothetical protein